MKKFLLLTLLCIMNNFGHADESDYNDSLRAVWSIMYDSVVTVFESGQFSEALVLAGQCTAFAERHFGEEDTNYIPSLCNEALLNDQMGNYEKADSQFSKTIRLAAKVMGTENTDYALYLSNYAFHFRALGRYNECESLLRESLAITKRLSGEMASDYALGLNELGGLLASMGRFHDAEVQYSTAISILLSDTSANATETGQIYNNLAVLFERMGRYQEADTIYRKSLRIYEKTIGINHAIYAKGLNNLAYVQSNLGNYAAAEDLYIRALQITRNVYGDIHPETAIVTMNMGLFYERLGQYSDAEKYYSEGLSIREEELGSDHPDVALSLNRLGMLDLALGKYYEAKTLFQQALRIWESIPGLGEKHPDYAITLSNLACSYYKSGIVDSAEIALKKSAELIKYLLGAEHPSYAEILSRMADYYELAGRPMEAAPLLTSAFKIREKMFRADHPLYGESLFQLARHCKIVNDTALANSYFLRQLENYRAQIMAYFPGLAESEKVNFYNTLKNNYEVFNSYAAENAFRQPFLREVMYNNRIFTKGLLVYAERKIAERIKKTADSSLIQKYNQWNLSGQLLAKLYSASDKKLDNTAVNIDSLAVLVKKLEKEISKKAGLFTTESDKAAASWKDIRNTLKPDEAAVEIIRIQHFSTHVTDTVWYAALIVTSETGEYPDFVLLTGGKELEGAEFEGYRNATMKLEKDTVSFRKFWGPVYEKTKNKLRIFLSPDGVYYKINLETLQCPDGNYLFDKQEIQTVTSTRDLLSDGSAKGQSSFSNGPAVLFGFPNYNLSKERQTELSTELRSGRLRGMRGISLALSAGSNEYLRSANFTASRGLKVVKSEENLQFTLSELPGTKIEVSHIMDIMEKRQWPVEGYVGEVALEEIVKAVENPSVLHIATHGYFLEDINISGGSIMGISSVRFRSNPLMRSGVFLAGATRNSKPEGGNSGESFTEDGVLTSYEAMNLNLDNTELVVLSACETGLGTIVNGEGVFGLQRALKVAGAKSVMMSLWKVDDLATQELMSEFYQNWAKTGLKRQSFNNAKKIIKEKFHDPFFWGGFILVGD